MKKTRPVSSSLNSKGQEVPDPVPTETPLHIGNLSRSTTEVMRDLIRRELSAAAQANDFETFEEADDFDIEDDPLDPMTEYERLFEPPAEPEAPQAPPQGGAGGPPPANESTGSPVAPGGVPEGTPPSTSKP